MLAAFAVATALTLVPSMGVAHGGGPVQRTLDGYTASNPATSALVWRLGPGGPTPVASYRAEVARIPASNMKLVTSAASLIVRGRWHRFTTTLYASPGAVRAGPLLRGPIYLHGSGDPLLATNQYARRYLAGGATSLTDLARPLKLSGVRLVRGPIVADETRFDGRRAVPGWPDYYWAYASPLSALTSNQNYRDDTRARFASSPARASAGRLVATLAALGVRHVGPIQTGPTPAGALPLASVSSPPLAEIVRAMNLDSDNFTAETLLKDLDAAPGRRATTAGGAARAQALLSGFGILGPGDRVADGSGLSRANRLSAGALVRLIGAADANSDWGATLIASLPRGGEGTLVRRFRNGPATKRVRAKTGYINGVSSLSGRVVSRNGHRYAFALLMNAQNVWAAHTVQDRIVNLLASGAEDPRPQAH